ncbi:MAG: c-type cytochrome [Acidobacteriota bacterium]
MKRSIPIILAAFAFFLAQGHRSEAADGKAVFDSLRCGTCHKAEEKATGASLKDIVKTYGGDHQKLVQFLKGEGKPLIETEKPGMMKGQIVKTSALPDEDRAALADYVLGFK